MRIVICLVFSCILIGLSNSALSKDDLPKHSGKCGELSTLNMGNNLDNCKVGDVILVQKKVVPMYCDYRYSIQKLDGKGVSSTYTCVMRVLRKERHNS